MNNKAYAARSVSRLYDKKLKQISFELRDRDENIRQKVFLLKELSEQAEALEIAIKIDLKGYQQRFDEYLKIKTDYDRHESARKAGSMAEASEA